MLTVSTLSVNVSTPRNGTPSGSGGSRGSMSTATPMGGGGLHSAAFSYTAHSPINKRHQIGPIPLYSFVFYRDSASPRGWSAGLVVKESVAINDLIEVIPLKFSASTATLLDSFRAAAKKPWAHFHNSSHTFAVEGGKPPTRNLSIAAGMHGAPLPPGSADSGQAGGEGRAAGARGHSPSIVGAATSTASSMGPAGKSQRRSVAATNASSSARSTRAVGRTPNRNGGGAGRSGGTDEDGGTIGKNEPPVERGGLGLFLDEIEIPMCNPDTLRHIQLLEAFKKYVVEGAPMPWASTAVAAEATRASVGANQTVPSKSGPHRSTPAWQQALRHPGSYFTPLPDCLFFELSPLCLSVLQGNAGASSSGFFSQMSFNSPSVSAAFAQKEGSLRDVAEASGRSRSTVDSEGSISSRAFNDSAVFAGSPVTTPCIGQPGTTRAGRLTLSVFRSVILVCLPARELKVPLIQSSNQPIVLGAGGGTGAGSSQNSAAAAGGRPSMAASTSRRHNSGQRSDSVASDGTLKPAAPRRDTTSASHRAPRFSTGPTPGSTPPSLPSPQTITLALPPIAVTDSPGGARDGLNLPNVEIPSLGLLPLPIGSSPRSAAPSPRTGASPLSTAALQQQPSTPAVAMGRAYARRERAAGQGKEASQPKTPHNEGSKGGGTSGGGGGGSKDDDKLSAVLASLFQGSSGPPQQVTSFAEFVIFDSSILEILPALLHTQHVADEAANAEPVDPSPQCIGSSLIIPRLTAEHIATARERFQSRMDDERDPWPLAVMTAFFPSDATDATLHELATSLAAHWIHMRNFSFSMVQHPFLSPSAMELSFEVKKTSHHSSGAARGSRVGGVSVSMLSATVAPQNPNTPSIRSPNSALAATTQRLEEADHVIAEEAVPSISKAGICAVLSAIGFRWSRSSAAVVDTAEVQLTPLDAALSVSSQPPPLPTFQPSAYAPLPFQHSPRLSVANLQHVELSFLKLDDNDLMDKDVRFFENMHAALPFLLTLSLRGNFLTCVALTALVNLWTRGVDDRALLLRIHAAQQRRMKRAGQRLSAAGLSQQQRSHAYADNQPQSFQELVDSSRPPGDRGEVAIRRLDVSLNRIGDAGTHVLYDALLDGRVAPSLTFINLEGNRISKEIRETALEAMSVPTFAPQWNPQRHMKCDARVKRRVVVLALCLLSCRDRSRVLGAARRSSAVMQSDETTVAGGGLGLSGSMMAHSHMVLRSPPLLSGSPLDASQGTPCDDERPLHGSTSRRPSAANATIPFMHYCFDDAMLTSPSQPAVSLNVTPIVNDVDGPLPPLRSLGSEQALLPPLTSTQSHDESFSVKGGGNGSFMGASILTTNSSFAAPSPRVGQGVRQQGQGWVGAAGVTTNSPRFGGAPVRRVRGVSIVEVPLPLSKEEADMLERHAGPYAALAAAAVEACRISNKNQTIEVDDDDECHDPSEGGNNAKNTIAVNTAYNRVRRMSVEELSHLARQHRERLQAAERQREHEERQRLIVSVAQYFSMFDRLSPLTVLW